MGWFSLSFDDSGLNDAQRVKDELMVTFLMAVDRCTTWSLRGLRNCRFAGDPKAPRLQYLNEMDDFHRKGRSIHPSRAEQARNI